MKYRTPEDYQLKCLPVQDKTLKYFYFMDKEHPLADKKGRVWYHRHVASCVLGRWLTKKEEVHHDDENRSNNSVKNLVVTKDHAEHGRHHRKRKLCNCDQCGLEFYPSSAISKFCSKACASEARGCIKLSGKELSDLVWNMPLTDVARFLGISDRAVSKKCRKLGVETPSRGYWLRKSS